jgi:hypothetical protein
MYGSLVLVSSLQLAAAWVSHEEHKAVFKKEPEYCKGKAGCPHQIKVPHQMPGAGECKMACEHQEGCHSIAYHRKDHHCHIMVGDFTEENFLDIMRNDHEWDSYWRDGSEEHDDEEAGLADPDVEGEDDAIAKSTPSLRSLLSPRDGVSSTGAPKLEGVYCGWSSHDGGNAGKRALLTFKGDKMHLQWKKREGDLKKHPPCSTHTPHEHECCLCAVGRNVDCKDEGYKVLLRPWDTDPIPGYDVQWTNTGDKKDCITKAMGVAKDNTFNHVPLRVKIHDDGHIELLEGKTQDGKLPDGDKVDLWKDGSTRSPQDSGLGPRDCSTWDDDHHQSPCRRRAGCKSRLLPVPSKDEEGTDEEFDDEEFDVDDIEVV